MPTLQEINNHFSELLSSFRSSFTDIRKIFTNKYTKLSIHPEALAVLKGALSEIVTQKPCKTASQHDLNRSTPDTMKYYYEGGSISREDLRLKLKGDSNDPTSQHGRFANIPAQNYALDYNGTINTSSDIPYTLQDGQFFTKYTYNDKNQLLIQSTVLYDALGHTTEGRTTRLNDNDEFYDSTDQSYTKGLWNSRQIEDFYEKGVQPTLTQDRNVVACLIGRITYKIDERGDVTLEDIECHSHKRLQGLVAPMLLGSVFNIIQASILKEKAKYIQKILAQSDEEFNIEKNDKKTELGKWHQGIPVVEKTIAELKDMFLLSMGIKKDEVDQLEPTQQLEKIKQMLNNQHSSSARTEGIESKSSLTQIISPRVYVIQLLLLLALFIPFAIVNYSTATMIAVWLIPCVMYVFESTWHPKFSTNISPPQKLAFLVTACAFLYSAIYSPLPHAVIALGVLVNSLLTPVDSSFYNWLKLNVSISAQLLLYQIKSISVHNINFLSKRLLMHQIPEPNPREVMRKIVENAQKQHVPPIVFPSP